MLIVASWEPIYSWFRNFYPSHCQSQHISRLIFSACLHAQVSGLWIPKASNGCYTNPMLYIWQCVPFNKCYSNLFYKNPIDDCAQTAQVHLSTALVSKMTHIQLLPCILQMLTSVMRSQVKFSSDDSSVNHICANVAAYWKVHVCSCVSSSFLHVLYSCIVVVQLCCFPAHSVWSKGFLGLPDLALSNNICLTIPRDQLMKFWVF